MIRAVVMESLQPNELADGRVKRERTRVIFGRLTAATRGSQVARWSDGWLLTAAIMAVLAAQLAACAVAPPPPQNPFVGTWSTSDNDMVTIRQDTVVETGPHGRSTALDRAACNGEFSFGYGSRERAALTGLLPRQPNLQLSLSQLLPDQSYPVAVLRCDKGDHTYVLLNPHELLAIYRDGDIGVIERLARR